MNHLIVTVLLTFCGAIRFSQGQATVCDPNPCKNGGVCQPPDKGYNWGYFCVCSSGYRGSQCQWDSEKCISDTKTPCQNGGKCVELQDGRFCMCPGDTDRTIRYGGHYCEIDNPCQSCPSNSKCHPAATKPSGRLCLNESNMVIA